jgi:hypothetical protein
MPDRICQLFFVPPISFARLGASTTPLAAYGWANPKNPRTEGETVVVPAWSLNILPDGSADPFRPDSIRFRDGNLLRPVCPFHELWARVGDPTANPSTWRDSPVTPALLQAEGRGLADLSFTVTARNLKVQRRVGRRQLAYGNFPPLVVRGDDHSIHRILGSSPQSGVSAPLIPRNRNIPLGSVQVLRPRPQPAAAAAPWAAEVNVEVVRLRFTPARGLFYGPPQAATVGGADGPAVRQTEAFLNISAGWFGSTGAGGGFVIPGDTFDVRQSDGRSLGVVDDTCEARIEAVLRRGSAQSLSAHANVFVGPPDYAPDRRPFVSVADELNDRDGDSLARNAALTGVDLDTWIADLFERIYDCVSLMNVDLWRANNSLDLPAGKRGPPLAGDGLPNPRVAMGGEDALRNRNLRVGNSTSQTPLPLTEHARERHRSLSDVDALRAFVLADPTRIFNLVRGPFESERLTTQSSEGLRATTMRMPPFMAQSTPFTPLTLTAWQYDLLLRWVAAIQAPQAVAAPPPAALTEEAAQQRDAVLDQLDNAGMMR